EFTFAEQRRRGRDMNRLAAVRRAGQRDLFTRQIEFVDTAMFEQRNRLKRFRGRAKRSAMRRIAGESEQSAARIDDGDGAVVGGFDVGAAIDGCETLHAREFRTGNLSRRGRPALRRDRLFLASVDLEHRIELGELEQFLDPFGWVDDDQLAVLRSELAEVANELADSGRVDVVDLREVDDDVRRLVLQ